jgi:hypothetical protein
MRINVTWADVRIGKTARTTECMVASALKRQLGVGYASVGHSSATLLLDGRYVSVRLPRAVERKIRFWDRFHFVLPFSFELPAFAAVRGA